ncbi:MAG TPA: energy-coupling factor transporter transmembrane component T [Anaerolineaceae bacterium]|nr:energy-coupling factor transporter transmembrane component T [Anaerolineaceae bacterium]
MAEGQHSLRYIERDAVMHRIYPLVKLAWVFMVAAGLFLYKTPLSGAINFVILLLLTVFLGKIPLREILSSSKFILGLGLILMFFHLIADPGNVVYKLGPLKVTDTGLIQGPIFFFRLSVVVLASFVLIWTTDTRDLMVSLAKAGIPYRFAFAVFLALRFLPLVQQEVDAVRSAHAIRGRASKSSLGHRIKLWQRYMFTILVNGLRKAEAAAAALECRAFGSSPTRTYVKDVHFHAVDLVLLIVTAAIITVLVLRERTGFLF